MLLGQEGHTGLQNQLNYAPLTYDQTGIAATREWKELPTKGDKSQEITKILRGPGEICKTLWLSYYTIWVGLLETLNWVLSL
jgi:hypothetical protein